jgi:hypothetical protein
MPESTAGVEPTVARFYRPSAAAADVVFVTAVG